MRSLSKLFLLGIALFTGGAAWAAAEDAQKLEAQARRYWAAEVQKDWGAVYDMLSPAGRGTQTRDEFIKYRKEVGPLHYDRAQVGEVVAERGIGWVHLSYDFELAKYPGARNTLETWQLWQLADAWRPVRPDERDQWPELPPNHRPAADEAALAKRSLDCWQAKVAQDWKSVYPFMSPEYREKVSLERFLKNRAKYLYYTPRVEWAEAKDDGGARVKVAFGYKTNDPATTKAEPRPSTQLEKWIKVDGNWYLDVPLPPDEEIAWEKAK